MVSEEKKANDPTEKSGMTWSLGWRVTVAHQLFVVSFIFNYFSKQLSQRTKAQKMQSANTSIKPIEYLKQTSSFSRKWIQIHIVTKLYWPWS